MRPLDPHYLREFGTAVLIAAGVASCASYPERTSAALGVFQSGQFERAIDIYADDDTTGSAFLSGAEAGSAAFAAGDWERMLEQFNRAADLARDAERAALISAESLAENLASLAVSESASQYTGEGYERVQLHAGLAMAYLAKGQYESARVEVRRANALLEREEELYEKSYGAGGLGHLLSAMTYELEGALDQAWIDYMRMVEKGVGAELAGRALARIARRTGREQEIPDLVARYGTEPQPPDDAASVVVVAGLGLGPQKVATTIPVPTRGGLLQWSVPSFQERPQLVGALRLEANGSSSAVRTDTIEDVAQVAKENLDDRIAWLAGRSVVRTVAKRELTEHLEDKWGGFGRVAGDLFTFITERADLRAWQTLPATWQAGRLFLPAGEHDLSLFAEGGAASVALGRFVLEPGETMFVFARQVGTTMRAHPIGGLALDVPHVTDEPTETPIPTTAEIAP